MVGQDPNRGALALLVVELVLIALAGPGGAASEPPAASGGHEAPLAAPASPQESVRERPAETGGREAGDPTVGLGDRVVAHASRLAARGPRPAASTAELEAARDVARELAALGLEVALEPFSFDDFEVESVSLTLAGEAVEPVALGIHPFHGPLKLSGEAVVLAGGEDPPEDLAGRLVVTDHPMMQLMIADSGPGAVVCVDRAVFARLAEQSVRSATLEVRGTRRTLESRNLVATLGAKTGPRVVVTAHLDAYQDSPGANDNATGLGALIELARILAREQDQGSLPVTMVAFGAEEVGAVGSRTYVERHREELGGVLAVVNLDTLGGNAGPEIGTDAGVDPAVETADGGVVPPGLRGVGWEGLDGRWRMLHPEILVQVTRRNSPDWLEAAVADAAAGTGIEPGRRNLISDHRSFTAAGVPATSIQSGQHTIHSPEDTPERLNPATVDAACRLAAALVARLRYGAGPVS